MKNVLLAGLLLFAGCATDVKVEKTAADLKAGDRFPHEIWTGVLKRINKGGFIDYRALIADRKAFDEYLGFLAKYSPSSHPALFPRREDAMAYLINAYNACTMRGVLDRYPLASVKSEAPAGNGFWINSAYPLGPNETFTLAQIEGKLRDMGDPRIHFAINCASLGCPRLPEEAFEPDRLEEQLERETRKFVNEERNVQVAGGTVRLSSILKWYRKDFREWQAAHGQPDDLLAYVRAAGREVPAKAEIEYLNYDWGLNEQKPEAGK